jgi:hypothetical protein
MNLNEWQARINLHYKGTFLNHEKRSAIPTSHLFPMVQKANELFEKAASSHGK